MCSKKFMTREFRTPLGTFTGKDVKTFLKTFSSIIKAVVARGLYGVYTLLVVWRVTEALQDPLYWLLLFCITLIALEAIHTIIARKGGELKWVTPSVFFYLVCAVPSIWLLELKLLSDRQQEQSSNSTSSSSEATSNSVININLSDEGWTLAMEQILIFVLIFGKWIAPKGELTRDQLSQLLLVNLGSGADIIELLETFNEDEVKVNSEIVYLVMSVWSWSLLQFCIVPTAYKELPDVDEPLHPESNKSRPCSSKSDTANLEGKHHVENEELKRGNGATAASNKEFDPESNESGPCSSKTDTTNLEGKEKNHVETEQSKRGNGAVPSSNNKTKKNPVLRSKSEGVAQALSNNGKSNTKGLVKGGSVGSSLNTKTGILSGKHNKVGFTAGSGKQDKGSVKGSNGETQHKDGEASSKENGLADDGNTKMKDEPGKDSSDGEDVASTPWDHAVIVVHDEADDLKLDDSISGWLSGRKCCVCFCVYTEIWGMILSLMFQDVPFLITRLFVMFHYGVVSHMTVFFTFKNVVIIMLLFNRIRVVVLEEHKKWKKHMHEVISVRKRNEEILREQKRGVEMKNEGGKHPGETQNGVTAATQRHSDGGETGDDTQQAVKRRKQWKLRKPKWRFWRI